MYNWAVSCQSEIFSSAVWSVPLFIIERYSRGYTGLSVSSQFYLDLDKGVVGCGEGVMYLMSLGRTTEFGLQLGKACYPFYTGKGSVEWFYFFCFFPSLSFLFLFLSCLTLSSPLLSLLPLFSLSLLLSLLSLFSHSLGDDTKWPTRIDVSLNPNTISQM